MAAKRFIFHIPRNPMEAPARLQAPYIHMPARLIGMMVMMRRRMMMMMMRRRMRMVVQMRMTAIHVRARSHWAVWLVADP